VRLSSGAFERFSPSFTHALVIIIIIIIYLLKIGAGQQGRISGTYNCPQYKIKMQKHKIQENYRKHNHNCIVFLSPFLVLTEFRPSFTGKQTSFGGRKTCFARFLASFAVFWLIEWTHILLPPGRECIVTKLVHVGNPTY